jgi:type I restriction enzyme R subunit
MQTPSFREDHIAQIPAIQMLVNMGYTYLSHDKALAYRGGKTSNVLLETVLRKQLREINSIKVSATRSSVFTDANIEAGIQALKELPMQEGYMAACTYVYNLLTLGKALEQTVDGDKKSFTLQYIDWANPGNNVFHVSEEFDVMRSNSREHYIPDLVLFVNGIPLCIIECKRPDMRDRMSQAISQHLRNQQEDGIRQCYAYSQILLSLATDEALYATNGTAPKFWAHWEEKFRSKTEEEAYKDRLKDIKNTWLPDSAKAELFGERFRYVRAYFEAKEKETVLPTLQDAYLLGLCSPERLLDFTYNFILFDNGEKKIARYQQFFAIKKAARQIQNVEDGRRKGGYIWHTQGSGKSLTMVMLAQAIAMDKTIKNPKIILVTDRTDLDKQITDTFRKCGLVVNNAPTGNALVEYLESKSDAVVTTIINKFETAVRRMSKPLLSPDIFVLVDEGHRTQHGSFNIGMQKALPNACFIAFTGTPLFKKDKKTSDRFGGEIDRYTVDKAVKDKAVVPLLYEGRHAYQEVNANPLDTFFNMVSEPLTDYQKADLKRKFSQADQLNEAEQKIYAICWDISRHFKDNFQGSTPFKGQLVCSSKFAAIRYKKFLDEINLVSSELVISAPDDREGEESAYGEVTEPVKKFWKKMMDEHGTQKRYEENIINRFKNQKDPEIIIVVDKLLTGFDEPKNTVLYITRNMAEHKLLQAIARVNRLYPDKDYGYIIDYYGVLGALDEALELYSNFQDFDVNDLDSTFTDIKDEISKLPQKHSELWDVFKTIINKKDAEAFQQHLRDEAIRVSFYDKLSAYARILKLALSSIEFHQATPEKNIQRYKDDLGFFMKLREAVLQRYSDTIDYRQYEGQIQKLIDTHIQTFEVKPITGLVNIFDKERFQEELEKTVGDAAKADKIASRTDKHISEKMEEDPAFYRKFSEMLKDTIRAHEEGRLSDAQKLEKVKEIMNAVLAHTDSELPKQLEGKDVAAAFFGIGKERLAEFFKDTETLEDICIQLAFEAERIILSLVKVNWQNELDVPNKMEHQIGDFLIDDVRDKYQIKLSYEDIDHLSERIVDVAKKRLKR